MFSLDQFNTFTENILLFFKFLFKFRYSWISIDWVHFSFFLAIDAVKDGLWTTWKPMWLLGFELIDKSVGILGLGRIGFGIAQRLQAFKVANIYYSDVKEVPYAQEVKAIYVTFDEMLCKSDIVCIACNLTDQTRGIFNTESFSKMKRTAVLVNVGRGGVVNHDDLYQALKSRKIGMAAIDVTDPEPLPANHPLMTLNNCVVTPHVASSTWESRNAMSLLTAENMLTILGGNDPAGRIRV